MSSKKVAKDDAYLGKAHCLDLNTGKVLCSGEGYFDVKNKNLKASFTHKTMAKWSSVMIVLETKDGFFATTRIYEVTSVPMGTSTQSYSMTDYLHWPLSRGIQHVLEGFKKVYITINAQHVKPAGSWDDKANSTSLVQQGFNKNLSSGKYANYAVTLKARSGLSLGRTDSSINTRLVFEITKTKEAFHYQEWLSMLLAFQLYWILNSDYTDCNIAKLEFGDSVTFITDDGFLKAFRSNVTQYSPIPNIDSDFSPKLLAKTLHFFDNPKKSEELGVSSKTGLAFSRVIGYRYVARHKRLDIEAMDLIFALQSFAEAFAEKEVNKRNKSSKTTAIKGIKEVLAEVEKIKDKLPEAVQDFYLKKPDVIYEILSRPTFKQSVEITITKLGLKPSDYKELVKIVDKTRRQVVHSQGYDSEYLIDTLITQARTDIAKNKEGRAVSMTFGEKQGSLDDLYSLNKFLFNAYFNQMES